MQIPLVDLKAQYAAIKPEILAAIEGVLEGMQLFLGPQTRLFEEEFAAFCGASHGVGVASGTDALELALRACQIGPGDEVITVANSFIATVEAIALVGARPVFVDIEPETYMMDWRQLEGVLTERTRAIIPVHLYGHPVEMRPVLDFARRHNLRVIEDASQAHGALYEGQPVGGLGDIGCFSLYCSKNLGAYGEAGICVTNDVDLAESMQLWRDHGQKPRYYHGFLGTNGRIDEIQSAILHVKMRYLAEWNRARQAHAQVYTEQLRGVVEKTPQAQNWGEHVYYVYVVEVHERDAFRQALEAEGIASGIHYPVPLHLQPACAEYGYQRGSFPVTERVAERIVSLPMYPELTAEQLARVVAAVKKSLSTKLIHL
ncbi:MAG TPA: DegT/DnrJ/EryC1/StrS family aminotransferase [Ktedonobacteraceae bacterium]|nr:DegT/DnrJ/EryC1/StrS family aminotransferase [Ktedonobacteraceae bacterium]